jgi:O-antigen ligase
MVKKGSIPFLPRWFAITLALLFAVSIATGYFNGKLGFSMLKQMIGITFSSVAYYNLFKFTNFDIRRVFNIYLRIAFFIALIGIIEELMLLRGMHQYFENVKRVSLGFYRVYSIMGEPYFLAVALIPALYYYIHDLFQHSMFTNARNKLNLFVIGLCYFFTFSSAGIFGFGIIMLLLAYNYGFLTPKNGRFIILFILAIIIIPKFQNNDKTGMQEFQVRANDSYKAFTSGEPLSKDEVADLNSSTFALYSNYIIALESFNANPISGSGLGTHEKTYDDYFESKFGKKFKIMYGNFNAKDANSLYIRLMSETGLFGLVLIFLLLFRFFLLSKYFKIKELRYYVIANQSVFIVIIIRLIRTGNYIGQGFFLFIFLYYLTYKFVKNEYARLESLPPASAK